MKKSKLSNAIPFFKNKKYYWRFDLFNLLKKKLFYEFHDPTYMRILSTYDLVRFFHII